MKEIILYSKSTSKKPMRKVGRNKQIGGGQNRTLVGNKELGFQ